MNPEREGPSAPYTLLSIIIIERLNYGFQKRLKERVRIISEVLIAILATINNCEL